MLESAIQCKTKRHAVRHKQIHHGRIVLLRFCNVSAVLGRTIIGRRYLLQVAWHYTRILLNYFLREAASSDRPLLIYSPGQVSRKELAPQRSLPLKTGYLSSY